MTSFSWKAVLVSPWWCHSKKADFTFVFTTTSGQEGFPCWKPSSDLLKLHVSQLFPSLEECKWDLNNSFSHCIFLTACLYLHEFARFTTFNFWYQHVKSIKTISSLCSRYSHIWFEILQSDLPIPIWPYMNEKQTNRFTDFTFG